MRDFCTKNNIEIRENEPLYKHSTFRIGGEAKFAAFPKSKAELISIISYANEHSKRYAVIGNASNVLFDDEGFDGTMIITKGITDCAYLHKNESTLIYVECGKSLTELSGEAGKKHGLTGLEFAFGIPGTVGGAIYMNAGAYGGEMADIVVETEYFDTSDGSIHKLNREDNKFSYRHSIFCDHKDYVIISAVLELKEGNHEDICAIMNKNMSSRKEKQPLEYPNAGSAFKRPEGHFAGKLIEDCGLKGFSVGGAQISEKHAGFVINTGNATARDVLDLIEYTKKSVMKAYSVELEREIIFLPCK